MPLRVALLGFVVLSLVSAAAESYDSPRLATLARALERGDRSALDQFWKEIAGRAPLIEVAADDNRYCWVTFLWRGSAATRTVDLLGTMPSSDPADDRLRRFADTDLWFKTERHPTDGRFGYRIRENDTPFVLDPLNPRVWAGRSVAELPAAPSEPWLAVIPGVPQGTVIEATIKSRILNEERAVGVYVPAVHRPPHESFNLLVVFDGESYRRERAVPTPTILDNLIASVRIPPTVAVLVNSQNTRDRDLLCSEPFVHFLTTELVPWVRENYHATSDPSRTIVAGSSYGGLAALCAALRQPHVFGNVLAQSGSFHLAPKNPRVPDGVWVRDPEWLRQQFVAAPKLPLRLYLQVGLFEGDLLAANRQLHDLLEGRGYPATYIELSGGHDYLSWRYSLPEGLIALFGLQRLRW